MWPCHDDKRNGAGFFHTSEKLHNKQPHWTFRAAGVHTVEHWSISGPHAPMTGYTVNTCTITHKDHCNLWHDFQPKDWIFQQFLTTKSVKNDTRTTLQWIMGGVVQQSHADNNENSGCCVELTMCVCVGCHHQDFSLQVVVFVFAYLLWKKTRSHISAVNELSRQQLLPYGAPRSEPATPDWTY